MQKTHFGRPLRVENIDKIITKISAVNKNIVTTQNTTKSKQTVVKTETRVKNNTQTITTKENKNTKTKEARVQDIFGVGFTSSTHGIGISLNAFSSTWGNMFIDWINLSYISSDYTDAFLLGVDFGYFWQLNKFFPYINGGIYYGFLDEYYYNNEYYDDEYYDEYYYDGIWGKVGVGADLKFSKCFKMFTNLDIYMSLDGNFLFGFDIGISVGTPAKR